MATDESFAEFVCEQLRGVNTISRRKMFGEYAIYAGRKVVAFACDNQLYLKPTAAGRAMIGTPTEAPPYPGASQYFLVDEYLDDADFLSALVRATAAALPEPKAKKPKKPKKR